MGIRRRPKVDVVVTDTAAAHEAPPVVLTLGDLMPPADGPGLVEGARLTLEVKTFVGEVWSKER